MVAEEWCRVANAHKGQAKVRAWKAHVVFSAIDGSTSKTNYARATRWRILVVSLVTLAPMSLIDTIPWARQPRQQHNVMSLPPHPGPWTSGPDTPSMLSPPILCKLLTATTQWLSDHVTECRTWAGARAVRELMRQCECLGHPPWHVTIHHHPFKTS